MSVSLEVRGMLSMRNGVQLCCACGSSVQLCGQCKPMVEMLPRASLLDF